MQVDTIIIKNPEFTHYHVSMSIYIARQMKHSSTKEKWTDHQPWRRNKQGWMK